MKWKESIEMKFKRNNDAINTCKECNTKQTNDANHLQGKLYDMQNKQTMQLLIARKTV